MIKIKELPTVERGSARDDGASFHAADDFITRNCYSARN